MVLNPLLLLCEPTAISAKDKNVLLSRVFTYSSHVQFTGHSAFISHLLELQPFVKAY